ncbi:uncharacterized protein EAF01_004524 [Botrytis porri]|uniref:uncharacterized protein n=1 Tax=Botrytis porri TaxID=87229 RepID=UPI001901BEFE|nr:uncharacterized protein EAF01_004524 [Botrytis porri]KAF7908769.1 hypothetical protein EAF01_004524 [Botrytis porri]
MGYPGKERQQQLRAAKGEGKDEFISLQFSGVTKKELMYYAALVQSFPSSSAADSSFGATTADFSAPQQLVFRPRVTATTPAASNFSDSVASGGFAATSTSQAPPADNASRLHATSQQPFSARIAAVAARRTGGRHHKRSRVPSQKERLSRRSVFRELTGVPLAALGLGQKIGGSVAADIIGNWPSEVLGEELLGSDDEEEEDIEDDEEEAEDVEDNEDEEMVDVGYDSDIYDSDGNEWAALGVNMKEGRP